MRFDFRVVAFLFALAAGPVAAQQPADLELVLLADASRSIDDGEIAFQRQGYATAITHPDVLSAIQSGPHRRIAVTYVEWGDADHQDVVVPWTLLGDEESAAGFANALLSAPRRAEGPNAIGSAIAFGHSAILGNDIEGLRRVIDVSADSAWTWGGVPLEQARRAAIADGIVINGLAVYCRQCASGQPMGGDMEAAFAERIIGGPGSFVIPADGRGSFAEAVRRKLLLEIAGREPRQKAAR